MGRLLTTAGFAVELFASGEKYLEAVDAGRPQPDCLVLDVHLRGMSGFELRDCLRARGLAVPIVFMTAVEFVRSIGEGWRERISQGQLESSLLLKPFDDHALLDHIGRALSPPGGAPNSGPGAASGAWSP